MRILAILGVFTAVLALPMTANAQPAQSTQGKTGKSQDLGAIRNKCRAEAVGYGTNASAQIRACVQREKAKSR